MPKDPGSKSKKDGEPSVDAPRPASGAELSQKWLRGEISLRELRGLTGPEMLAIAMQGYQLYEQGRYDKAKVVFEGLCILEPSESYYRTALGAVYLAEDNLEMAEKLLSAAIRLNKDELASYVNRGEVYLRQGKVLEAAQDFKRAVELDPQQKDPISQRARLLATATLETIRSTQRQSRGATSSKPPGSSGTGGAAQRKK